MSYQVLARKWRPKTFKQLVGQEHVVQALVNGLEQDRLHHAFLFTGTRGVGKTTIARILAKCLNCETGVTAEPCGTCSSCVDIDEGRFVDMLEVDAASRTKVDDTRELLESVHYTPTRGRYKVYIIDEVHMLSTSSFNALLKTLEEPPQHVKFVLATTDPQKIPVTILSRCLRFNLRRLLPGQIGDYLNMLLQEESIEAEAAAVERIARAADGSMRDSLSLLDQAIAYGGGKLVDEDVARMLGSIDHAYIADMIRALAQADAMQVLGIMDELAAQSRNLEVVLAQLAESLHRIALVQLAPDYQDIERSDWDSIKQLSAEVSAEDVQLFYQIAIQGRQDLGMAPDPRTGVEMTLLRMLAFRPAKAGTDGGSVQSSGKPSTASKPASPSVTQTAAAAPRETQPVAENVIEQQVQETVDQPSAPASDQASLLSEPAPQPPQKAIDEAALNWHELTAELNLSGPVRELARNIQLQSATAGQWQFAIPHAVEHLGTPPLVEKLQRAVSDYLGNSVQMKLSATETSVLTPAAVSEQESQRLKNDAQRAITDDPTVQSLQEKMDARIIPDSIQPLQ